MTTKSRDDILERIANLREHASNDAATESESNAALTMAAKLMDSYRVTEAELAVAETEGRISVDIVHKTADVSYKVGRNRHKVMNVMCGIERLTGTQMVMKNYNAEVEITGDRPDVEMANYLFVLIREALDRQYEEYKRGTPALGRGAKASFQTAMSHRISSRLYEMARAAEKERREAADAAHRHQTDGGEQPTIFIADEMVNSATALVIADAAAHKAEEVRVAFKERNPRLRSARGFGNGISNGSAHSAGAAAGNRVHLGRAVGGNRQRAISA